MAFLSCGSNRGDRKNYVDTMVSSLAEVLVPPVRKSLIMETEPIGVPGVQKWYINVIIGGTYTGSARELLVKSREIEVDLGRISKGDRMPRTADIDILLFGNQIINDDDLVVPHPEIAGRRFCIEGLNQIASDMIIPGLNTTVHELYEHMNERIRKQNIRFFNEDILN
ncbi:MAG: 2-amino-4-hydroxy-6-hydroxymethyldihydropteridine diphosphokinase [Chitinivibrionales bacterium]|nr:2-amino-4-hydroxy-6-hydroxymethyldihydropteridine diphosphokinase [Chitinivibrionales bacterium]